MVGKVDGEHLKELLLKLVCGEVSGGAFDGVVELVDALPYESAVFVGEGQGVVVCLILFSESPFNRFLFCSWKGSNIAVPPPFPCFAGS